MSRVRLFAPLVWFVTRTGIGRDASRRSRKGLRARQIMALYVDLMESALLMATLRLQVNALHYRVTVSPACLRKQARPSGYTADMDLHASKTPFLDSEYAV